MKVYKRIVEIGGEGWFIVQEIEESDGRKVQTMHSGPFPTRVQADAVLVGNVVMSRV